jgi:hypothetical protein
MAKEDAFRWENMYAAEKKPTYGNSSKEHE